MYCTLHGLAAVALVDFLGLVAAENASHDSAKLFLQASAVEAEMPVPPGSARNDNAVALPHKLANASEYSPIYAFDSAASRFCLPSQPSASMQGVCNGTWASGHAPTFVQKTQCGDQIVYSYWLWYGWQTSCLPAFDAHDNDWEHISVFVNATGELDRVIFYQHGGFYSRCSGQFEQLGNHPVVYIGRYAHGSYHDGCTSGWSRRRRGISTCHGDCSYFDDLRSPAHYARVWDSPLIDLQPGHTVDGVKRPDSTICQASTCSDRGCERDAPCTWSQ
eukprot:gb/GFBE01063624.1/.p1 GENE.gb/GFBE01063624.1/~~gb/GFBE01063624.1/.p1  ORF type:complete len:276 (+),score=29.36 gb/GFBE01063624.1/:1-828(+)